MKRIFWKNVNRVRKIFRILGVHFGLEFYKARINKKIFQLADGKILCGPFSGLKISNIAWWGHYDKASKILGLYEATVLQEINQSSGYETFVDIGAADGYYALGVIHRGIAKTATCFERSSIGRSAIKRNAAINGLIDKIQVMGQADVNTLSKLDLRHGALVLIDIEGFEYELLSAKIIEKFLTCKLIIELHPFLVNGERLEIDLVNRLKKHFKLRFLYDHVRDTTNTQMINELTSDERSLILSEGRQKQMRWLVATPISSGQLDEDEAKI